MSGRSKLISGIFLFIIGCVILLETTVYNLIDIFLLLGFILTITGIIIIISYFVDSSSVKNSNNFHELIYSSNNSDQPLKINKPNKNSFFSEKKEIKTKKEPSLRKDHKPKKQIKTPVDSSNPKAVLNIVEEDEEIDLGDKLKFTPNYDKPLKVTRKPKKRENEYVEKQFSFYDKGYDKSEEIKKALSSEAPEIAKKTDYIPGPALRKDRVQENVPERDIKIDINNPESLPVPKQLRSFVVCKKGTITSQEAFEELSIYVHKEILLQIPSLNDLTDRFLSQIPTVYSRLIIEDFDGSDISYIILIASLLKQKVKIRTIPKIHNTNLIADDSHALIISNNNETNFECGAIYSDKESISQIINVFDRIWNLSKDLNESDILTMMNR